MGGESYLEALIRVEPAKEQAGLRELCGSLCSLCNWFEIMELCFVLFVFNREWTLMDANFFGGYVFIRVHWRSFVVQILFWIKFFNRRKRRRRRFEGFF